jgi:AsmA protein
VNAVTAFKRLGLAMAAVAVVVACVGTAMTLLISTDAVREQAKAEIRAATGLDPVFNGKSSVSLFPSGQIVFEDVRLGDSKDPALTAAQLTVRLRFLPMLIGRAETADVTLERPTIAIVVSRDGRSNWSSLLITLARSRAPEPRPPSSFSAIRINGGTIKLRDEAHDSTETFENVELSLAWPSISKSFGASGHFVWRDQPADASLVVSDFGDVLAGNRTGIKARLSSTLGKIAFDGSASSRPTFKLEGTLSADAPSLRRALRWAGKKPLPGGGFERFAIKSQINVVGGTVALSGVNLELDGNTVEGVLTFAMDGRQALQGTLAADALDLRPYMAPVQLTNQRGWSDGHVTLDGLTTIDADLRLSAASVQLTDAKLGRSAMAANLRSGNLVVTIGESQAFGGIIKGAISLTNLETGMDVRSQLQFTDVDLEGCLSQLFKLRRLEGKGNVALVLQGSGASVMAITRTLSGSATLTGKDGALLGVNVEQLLRRLERRPLSAGTELRSGRTPYQSIAITLKIADGTASVQEVQMDGSAIRLALNGTASIPAREVDLTGVAALLPTSAGVGYELPFIVQGSWDNPTVLPDPQILIRRSGAAAPLLNAVKDRSAREAVRSAIERLTGRPAPAVDTATPAR